MPLEHQYLLKGHSPYLMEIKSNHVKFVKFRVTRRNQSYEIRAAIGKSRNKDGQEMFSVACSLVALRAVLLYNVLM